MNFRGNFFLDPDDKVEAKHSHIEEKWQITLRLGPISAFLTEAEAAQVRDALSEIIPQNLGFELEDQTP